MPNKRKINEVIALYDLEPHIKDIYVEGATDKKVINNFLKNNDIDEVNVITAEDIDFTEIYDEQPNIKRNNKNKLIALSNILKEKLELDHNGITVVIDRDFDDIKNALTTNTYISYTDYNSMELYLYNEDTIDKYYNNVLTNFPLTGKESIELMTPILTDKFLIRLVLKLNSSYKKENIISLSKSITITKDKKRINFNLDNHLFKILNNIGETRKLEEYIKQINDLREKLSNEKKINIRGHDFTHLLYTIIKRIKNRINLGEDIFEKTIFLCIDYNKLSNEPLFLNLRKKYAN